MTWSRELRELRALLSEVDAREERALMLRNRLNRAPRAEFSLCRTIEDEERSLLWVREQHRQRVARAEARIALMSDAQGRSVLTLRYLLGMRWERVARRLGCERTTLWRIHKRALTELDGGVLHRENG